MQSRRGASVRVALADASAMFCEALVSVLDNADGMSCVGTAHTDEETWQLLSECHPDVLLLDPLLPATGAVGLSMRLEQSDFSARLLLIAETWQLAPVCAVMRSGARGVITRRRSLADLTSALRLVAEGGVYCDPDFAAACQGGWTAGTELLTNRERAVVTLVARGYSTRDIACALYVSPRTVDHMRERIRDKLAVGNSADLIRFAIRTGLAEP